LYTIVLFAEGMLVFIDESGDAGFKVTKGSSATFVIGLVAFTRPETALEAQRTIENLRVTLGVKPEFKFSKCRPDIRDKFFSSLADVDYCVRALVVQKERIYSGYLRENKEAFYSFFVKTMLRFDNGLLQNAKVVIDGSGERVFKKELASYLRRHTAKGAIQKIRFSDSKSDSLVQMADMCTGAIARDYRENRKDGKRWRNMLSKKIDDVWEFE
jgi:hypothetical protein